MRGGRLSVHQRVRQSDVSKGWPVNTEKWRLRRLGELEDGQFVPPSQGKKHPCDPGWERGDYRYCHDRLREAIAEGKIIFDVVNVNGTEKQIIRSAFTITNKEDTLLEFEEFYFLDGNPDDGIDVNEDMDMEKNCSFTTNAGIKVNESKTEKCINQMESSDFYNHYEAGEKPKSIDKRDWEMMVEEAEKEINGLDTGECGSC